MTSPHEVPHSCLPRTREVPPAPILREDPDTTAEVTQVAAHRLTVPATCPVDARTGRPFDAQTYSRMKHGDLDAVETLAADLAEALLAQCPDLAEHPREPVFPVAYKAVPPGCWHLARAVLTRVDAERRARGLAPGRIVKVHKDAVTHTDYAASTDEERRAELARIGFALTEPIDGANVVVVDDVRVTGQAESTILAALAGAGAARLVTAYVAVCDARLAASPQVEAALNHAEVTGVLDLLPAVRAGRFGLTIRFLKRALASADLRQFLRACPPSLVRRLHEGAVATGADFVAAYPEGMAALDEALARRPQDGSARVDGEMTHA